MTWTLQSAAIFYLSEGSKRPSGEAIDKGSESFCRDLSVWLDSSQNPCGGIDRVCPADIWILQPATCPVCIKAHMRKLRLIKPGSASSIHASLVWSSATAHEPSVVTMFYFLFSLLSI